jgi:alpha-galactosidase
MRLTLAVLALLLFMAPSAQALDNGLARTPPMGFNDWNAFGCDVSEQLIEETADYFVSSGMRDAGYRYVNIDDCWMTHERDAQGRLVPDPVKFPDGIAGTADYVHSKGLKLGIYEDAGTATCAGYPGSLGHEKVDAQTFADWGVDYLKYDNCNNAGSTTKEEYIERYSAMRDALAATGRPIVYSICEWGVNEPWTWAPDVGNLWRTTGDISDNWTSLKSIVDQNAPLHAAAGPGAWNDPDMLEVGNGGMTDTEYRSHFSLWAMMAAPLLAGTDLREATPETMAIYLNRDVIAVDQDRLGKQGRVVKSDGQQRVFRKPLADGADAVALFNAGDTAAVMSGRAAGRAPAYRLKDLWSKQVTETAGRIAASVAPHGTVIYRATATRDWKRYAPATALSVAAPAAYEDGPVVAAPAERTVVRTRLRDAGREAIRDAHVRLAAPAGWQVTALTTPTARRLRTDDVLRTRWAVTPAADAAPGTYTLAGTARYQWHQGRRDARTSGELQVVVPPAPPTASASVSDLLWSASSNGWGPAERDQSNGETAAGDGKPITIGAQTFAKGVGAHAAGEVDVYVGGRCSAFSSSVGIDDEVGDRGSVDFQVFADGALVADSGTVSGTDPPRELTASLAGARFVRLVVGDAGDGNSYDHADWADAHLTCA